MVFLDCNVYMTKREWVEKENWQRRGGKEEEKKEENELVPHDSTE